MKRILLLGLTLLALALPVRAQGIFGDGSSTSAAPSATATPTPTPTPTPQATAVTTQVPLDSIIPAETEILLSLNTSKLVSSGLLETVLQGRGMWDKMQAQARLVEQLTGVNFLRDVTHLRLMGRVNDEENVVLAAEGRFDPARLVTLVQTNPEYQQMQEGALTIHAWKDDKDARVKYATFLNPTLLVIFNSQAAFDACKAAYGDPARRLKAAEVQPLVPAGANDKLAWGVMITRRPKGPGARLQVASARVALDVAGNDLQMEGLVRGTTPEANQQWQSVLEGLVALGQLQRKNMDLVALASRFKVAAAPDGVSITGTVDKTQALNLGNKVK